ncbi:MAG: zinc ribbon domain-containing protein [Syntrophobacterales bacterium CG03_land_8_20_14_0_80_58_14]|nr:MAG: zinc ribbon domain-containing protein [Syntrophobacterales bacterium CG03_land_8_20_14_0_80_58_14]
MPIYEYACTACGHCFERIMKVGEASPACPACGATETEKRVAPFRTNAWSSFLDGMEKRVNPHKFK